jgi:hypothetical protein
MHWQYTKRPDGKIAITLDNNVWNFLFDKNIDLASELPADLFTIHITREIEIETLAIPDRDSKKALKEYIAGTIASCGIKTTWVFGFAHEGPGPQRHGGFGVGTWQSQTEQEFYAAIRERFLIGKSQKNSMLSDNEGDAAVAAKSFSSIALTCELPDKIGPLRFASEHGGKVLYLESFERSGLTLRVYIETLYQEI